MNNNQDISKLYAILYQDETWLNRRSLQNKKVEAIKQLRYFGNTDSINVLLSFLNHDSNEIRTATVKSIEILFNKFDSKNTYETSLRHCNMQKSDIKKYVTNLNKEELKYPLAIASFNNSGYVREEALNQIYKHNLSAELLPFVIFRLNDWVSEVSAAAEKNYTSILIQENWHTLVNHLDLIFWMKKVQRIDLTKIYNQTIGFLLIENKDETYSRFSKLDERNRFLLCKEILKIDPIKQNSIDTLVADKSYLVRSKLAENLHRITLPQKTIEKLSKDKSGIVRQRCLESSLKIHSELQKIDLKELLNDRSGTIRNLARFYLKDSNIDFLEHYKLSLQNEFLSESSIYGIGEVGSKSEVELLLSYIDSDNIKIKRAAIRTLLKLDASRITTQLIKELDSNNKSLRRLATEYLSIAPSDITLDKCRDIFSSGNSELKLSMLVVFGNGISLKTLPDLLIAVTDKDESISNAAWSYLINWKKRSISYFSTSTENDTLRAIKAYSEAEFQKELSPAKKKLWKELPYFGRFETK